VTWTQKFHASADSWQEPIVAHYLLALVSILREATNTVSRAAPVNHQVQKKKKKK
jgi:hypothetical protein